MKLNVVDIVAYVLVVVGGINWGLVGWWKYNLVEKIFGVGSTGSRIVYAVVGLAALYMIYLFFKLMSQPKVA
jgi:uncharacterized protein